MRSIKDYTDEEMKALFDRAFNRPPQPDVMLVHPNDYEWTLRILSPRKPWWKKLTLKRGGK